MCEVMNVDMTPHASNTRAALVESAENFGEFEPWFGMEQEFFVIDVETNKPLGLAKNDSDTRPQGPYYCGVGGNNAYGRTFFELSETYCLYAGIPITGKNYEPYLWYHF